MRAEGAPADANVRVKISADTVVADKKGGTKREKRLTKMLTLREKSDIIFLIEKR